MKGINTFTLKLIGLVSMVVDHVGMLLFPEVTWLRIIGRLAFPIFAYVAVEGFCYTKDIRKYILRLTTFGILSEIPFDLATSGKWFSLGAQNVMFTFVLGLLMLYGMLRIASTGRKILFVFAMLLVADLCLVDYGALGLGMMLVFYQLREEKWQKTIGISVINLFLMGKTQAFGALAMVPIWFHNRQQGPRVKWLFGLFYPLHLLILYGLAKWL